MLAALLASFPIPLGAMRDAGRVYDLVPMAQLRAARVAKCRYHQATEFCFSLFALSQDVCAGLQVSLPFKGEGRYAVS
jgi:hypothetical protein